MTALTSALIDYWQQLPGSTPAARHRSFDDVCRRVHAGERDASALIPYALADADEELVFGATTAFLNATGDSGSQRALAVLDATEWVRRGLALNRGAVFAALLLRGDEAINEHLLPLRLTLSAEDVATICRRAARRPCERSRRFLREWHELLSGDAAAGARRHIACVLDEACADGRSVRLSVRR